MTKNKNCTYNLVIIVKFGIMRSMINMILDNFGSIKVYAEVLTATKKG